MHIGIIAAYFWPRYGGGERQLGYLTSALASRGDRVSVATLGLPGVKPEFESRSLRVTRFGTCTTESERTAGYSGVLRWLERSLDQLDVLYMVPNPYIAVRQQADILELAAHKGLPVVLRVSSSGRACEFCQGEGDRRRQYLSGKFFLALNEDIVTELSSLGVPRARIVRIRNGVCPDLFCPVTEERKRILRDRMNLDHDAIVFLIAARFSPKKRIELALTSCCAAAKASSQQNVVLLIAGGGNSDIGEGSVEEQIVILTAAQEGLKVRLLGPCAPEAMPDLLRVSDILVCASVQEGMPNIVLEAMSCGLTVVAPDVSSYRFMSRANSVASYSFNPSRRDGLVHSLVRVMREEKCRREEIGLDARKVVLDRFSLPRTLRTVVGTLEEASGKRTSSDLQ